MSVNQLTPAGCDAFIADTYSTDEFKASAVLTRTIDPATEDFTAQRAQALQPATS